MAAAGVGMAAAIAIPNFTRARETSQKNACINNLRLIDSAKQQWALEHNKTSTDIPTMEDLKPYFAGRKGSAPTCPAHGTYTIGSAGEKPTCSVAGHELP
jgi:competence protein ComGC